MTKRRPLIAGNWKMYKTPGQAAACAELLNTLIDKDKSSPNRVADVMIAPPFTALSVVAEILKHSIISLGAQNLHWADEGAYTGEVSASMLKAIGCRFVIVGHSERRQFFGENDDDINRKLNAAIKAQLSPILCVGETEHQRENKETFSVLDKQIQKGLQGLTFEELGDLVVAYEPIWAIGTGKTASVEQAQEVHQFIRNLIEKSIGGSLYQTVRILYGGSVKPDNIAALMAMPDVDGALVGGASLEAEAFSRIVNYK